MNEPASDSQVSKKEPKEGETLAAPKSQDEDSVDASPSGLSVKDIATVVDTKPASALLTPAFTEIGNYFGERAADWVAAKRRKREQNLEGHVAAVLAKAKPSIDEYGPTERQAEAAVEWAEGAQTVDPSKEAELAALWQGLLEAIYADDDEVDAMQTALTRMKSSEARFLLNMRPGWQALDGDDDRVAGLVEHRLIRRFTVRDVFRGNQTMYYLTFLVAVIFLFVYPNILELGYEFELSATYASMYRSISTVLIIASGALFLYFLFRRLGTYKLSRLGYQLRTSAERYLKQSAPDRTASK